MGKKLLPNAPQMPPPVKQALALAKLRQRSVPRGAPPVMCRPGATRSGFAPVSVGPREEKSAISLALSADTPIPHASFPPKGHTFSAAPTVMMFLAVPGVVIELLIGLIARGKDDDHS
ncbi:MAG: hypothetical protein U0X75_28310 [Acidobacteriota bacterium]